MSENNQLDFTLTEFEADTIGEILNISMGSAATAISTMLDRKVVITTPRVTTSLVANIEYGALEPAICVQITYVEGITGSNIMLFRQQDMAMILDQLMGREPTPIEEFVFDELSISAACEVMNQMMGASATALSSFLGRAINISTPNAFLLDQDLRSTMGGDPSESVAIVKFDLSIEGIMSSEFMSIMSKDLTKEIIAQTMSFGEPEPLPPPPPPSVPKMVVPPPPQYHQETAPPPPPPQQYAQPQAPPPQQYAQQAYAPAPPAQYPPQYAQPGYGAYPPPPQYQQNVNIVREPVNVRNASFEQLDDDNYVNAEQYSNLGLLMSVPMQVTIEIGKTQKRVKEIMDFTQGTIIELDKQAGAPVDIIVNGQPVARGDVVVIDDNFAVRITEILKTKDLFDKI